jgi:crossover junction endodeoxyribonuclease RuvC
LNDTTRILGIDPGSRVTGFGIIESHSTKTRYVASGCLNLGDGEFTERLREIFMRIGDLVEQYAPAHVAVEQVFVHKNADSALKLGQARASAICATFPGKISLYEYAPRQIKQAVVGGGGAHKQQVQHMVKAILAMESLPLSDEADALAVAICHANCFRFPAGRQAATLPARRGGGRSSWRKFAG